METNVNYTLVGAFVITISIFIVLTIIWLTSGFSVGQYKTYKVYMNESVAGLNIDSNVEFNGVNVGSVKSIEIDAYNPHLVILLLSIKTMTPVTQGTRAVLASKGLTGVAYVALIDQGKDLNPLKTLKDEPYPVIATAPSFLGRLDTALHTLADSLAKATNSIETLLDTENLRAIKEILFDVRHVTHTLSANTKHMNSILENTAKGSAQFGPLIQSSQQIMSMLSTQILPATNQAMMNLDYVTQNLSDISTALKQNPAVIIRGTQPPLLGPGESR